MYNTRNEHKNRKKKVKKNRVMANLKVPAFLYSYHVSPLNVIGVINSLTISNYQSWMRGYATLES